MCPTRRKLSTVDAYIAASSLRARPVLHRLRMLIRNVSPDAVEKIRYNIPAYALDGSVVSFAAFETYVALYPALPSDDPLWALLERYRGQKGNLQFPLTEPLPYALVARVVKVLHRENRTGAVPRGGHEKPASKKLAKSPRRKK